MYVRNYVIKEIFGKKKYQNFRKELYLFIIFM